ncbi:hypothetical protein [Amaricoccus sp.]|nr:hypothetical protein [Amaricoccus sp.]HRO12549.1 hypothetical protein [Amaricoccus sp.]
MKILAALVTALTLVGFGSVAFADCAGHVKAGDTAQSDRTVLPPEQQASS